MSKHIGQYQIFTADLIDLVACRESRKNLQLWQNIETSHVNGVP